ncbi:MAG: sortase [Candidatus Pacebacteria bacterium]|nr:sortase [Candidatus Paceibacterota bacterium]
MDKNSFKKTILKFMGLFLILFLIVFAFINIINFLSKPRSIDLDIAEPENIESKCVFTEKPDSILIPKINIEAPIVFTNETEAKDLEKALNQGVLFYPLSDLPNEKGQVVLLGHSAPVGWPKIRYDWVFTDIDQLEIGDSIYVFLENCQYSYKMTNKYFLEKGDELPEYDSSTKKSQLFLISCWPPGKDLRRIAVEAEQI